MPLTRRSFIGALAALPPVLLASGGASADTPEAKSVVEAFHEKLLETMKAARTLGFEGRMRAMQPAVEKAYNLPVMGRLAVGPQWQSFSPDEQKRFIELFGQYSAATYANRFDGYDGERFETLGEKPQTAGNVIIETQMVPKAGDPTKLNYLMSKGQSGWQIIDVFANGTISQVAVLRSDFTAVLKRDGVAGLLEALERKISGLRSKT